VVATLDDEYLRRFGTDPADDRDLLYFVGDNPSYSMTWSAVSGRVPTYRRNSGKYVHRQTMTWLTAVDKLASLGWPVTPEVAEAMGVPIVPVTDNARADVMAGNAMHFTNSAVVLLVGLACFGKHPGPTTP
jgi:hypothetical protein